MFPSFFRIALSLAFVLAANPVQAALVEEDLVPFSGDGLITHDTATDLFWLDLTETVGLSWNDVMAGAGGWIGSGWRHATTSEICDLLEEANMPVDPCPGTEVVYSLPLQTAWNSLFGTTDLILGMSVGAYDDGDPAAVGAAGVTVYTAAYPDLLLPTDTLLGVGVTFGHFLVRTRCADGIDQDGDSFVDLADPDCTDAQDDSEYPAQCDDGIDQDGDGLTDTADPDCTDTEDDAEWHLAAGDILQNTIGGELYRIDPATGDSTPLATIDDSSGNAALGASGAVYMAEVEVGFPLPFFSLRRVDPDQGGTTFVGPMESFSGSLSATADGRIFYGGGLDTLYSMDLATGVETAVSQGGLLSAGTADGPDHVLVESSGTVLVVVETNIFSTVEPALLVRVDPTDGSQTQLAQFGPVGISGMDFDVNGDLIVASAGNIFTAVPPEVFRVPMPAGGVPVPLTGGTGLSFVGGGLVVENDGVYGVGSWLLGGSETSVPGVYRFPSGTTPPVLLTDEFGSNEISAVRPPVGVGGPALCENGIDDDGDGLVDYPDDPGCASATSPFEAPQCSDGVDNDGDGDIDLADGQCASAADNREAAGKGCGLGTELAILLPMLAAWRRRPAFGWNRK